MAIILHLETSGPFCSVAVARDGRQLSLIEHSEQNTHAQQITLIIDKALSAAQITLSEIDAIAISQGPGSYTGLRVSASAAKGICYARDIPLIAIDTLRSLASMAYILDGDQDAIYIPMIDARRMEVYTALYEANGRVIVEPHAKIIDNYGYGELVTDKTKSIVYCGSGVAKCMDIIDGPSSKIYLDLFCKADNLIALAYEKYLLKEFSDLAYFKPFYLKSPNITKSKPML